MLFFSNVLQKQFHRHKQLLIPEYASSIKPLPWSQMRQQRTTESSNNKVNDMIAERDAKEFNRGINSTDDNNEGFTLAAICLLFGQACTFLKVNGRTGYCR